MRSLESIMIGCCDIRRRAQKLTQSHMQASKISQEYEKRGGGYENEPGSKNEPTKGAPQPKSDDKKDSEVKENGEKSDDKPEGKTEAKEKPKANSAKKATGKKTETKPKAPKKEKKQPTEGTRKSSRVAAGNKRSAPEEPVEEEAPAKKTKTGKK